MATIAEVDKVVAAMFAHLKKRQAEGGAYVHEDDLDTERELVLIDGDVDLRRLAVVAIEALRNG